MNIEKGKAILNTIEVIPQSYDCAISAEKYIRKFKECIQKHFAIEDFDMVEGGMPANICVDVKISKATGTEASIDPLLILLSSLSHLLLGAGFLHGVKGKSMLEAGFLFRYPNGEHKSVLFSHHSLSYQGINECIDIVNRKAILDAIKSIPERLAIPKQQLPIYLKIGLIISTLISLAITYFIHTISDFKIMQLIGYFILNFMLIISVTMVFAPANVFEYRLLKRYYYVFLNMNTINLITIRIQFFVFAFIYGCFSYNIYWDAFRRYLMQFGTVTNRPY